MVFRLFVLGFGMFVRSGGWGEVICVFDCVSAVRVGSEEMNTAVPQNVFG